MPRASRSVGGVVSTTLIVSALVGIVLGLVALFQPGATLVTIALLFGIALIVAGLFRLIWALADSSLSSAGRLAMGLLGLVVLAAGVLALFRPGATLVVVGVLIGLSWILSGLRDLAFGVRDSSGATRGLAVVSGAISVLGGIAVVVLPFVALQVFAQVAGILLIIVSAATLLTLPARRSRA